MKIMIIPESTYEGDVAERLNSFQLLSRNFVSIISGQLKLKKLNKSWLAGKMKVSAPAISKLLATNTNPTLKTIADVADALNIRIELKFSEKRNLLEKLDAGTFTKKPHRKILVNSPETKEF